MQEEDILGAWVLAGVAALHPDELDGPEGADADADEAWEEELDAAVEAWSRGDLGEAEFPLAQPSTINDLRLTTDGRYDERFRGGSKVALSERHHLRHLPELAAGRWQLHGDHAYLLEDDHLGEVVALAGPDGSPVGWLTDDGSSRLTDRLHLDEDGDLLRERLMVTDGMYRYAELFVYRRA